MQHTAAVTMSPLAHVSRASAMLALAVIALLPVRAEAQSASIAAGADLYMGADFEGAIEALEGALATERLTLADVELALDRLAAARLAIGDAAGLERTLGALAIVAPSHLFGPDVPTELSAQFVEILMHSIPITVALSAEPGGGSGDVLVRAGVRGDAYDVVRQVTLTCRAGSHQRDSSGDAPTLTVSEGAVCDAVAVGPGGLELTRAHRDGAAVRATAPDATAQGGGPDPLVLGLGIGGGVLALGLVVGIIAGVAVSNSGASGADLMGPMVRW